MTDLSIRATSTLPPTGAFDFIKAHFDCENNAYSPDNPTGFVNMGSSQNLLFHEALCLRLNQSELSSTDFNYLAFYGKSNFLNTLSNYLNQFNHANIDSNELVIGNGIINLLEALTFCITDSNDTVVVPTPVFPALITSVYKRMNCNVEELFIDETNDFRITAITISKFLTQLKEKGKPAKVLLLCSPGNPSGQVFSEKELSEISHITEQFHCHLVIDEVYAQDVFINHTFYSALNLDRPHVHVIGGFSKDFGMAGYAFAWLHSKNTNILNAMKSQSHFFRVSNQQQSLLYDLLADIDYCRQYLKNNRETLTNAYSNGLMKLSEASISIIESDAGLSMWIDLRPFLKQQDFASELHLYQHLLNEFLVHISPGQAFKCQTAGFFRLCFSLKDEVRNEGFNRIINGLKNYT